MIQRDPLAERLREAVQDQRARPVEIQVLVRYINGSETKVRIRETELESLLAARGSGLPATADLPPQFWHAPDFRSIVWFGQRYTFSRKPAAAVGKLWEAWENKSHDVSQGILLRAADSASERLVDLFKGNTAWGTVIVRGESAGTYRLSNPDDEPLSDSDEN